MNTYLPRAVAIIFTIIISPFASHADNIDEWCKCGSLHDNAKGFFYSFTLLPRNDCQKLGASYGASCLDMSIVANCECDNYTNGVAHPVFFSEYETKRCQALSHPGTNCFMTMDKRIDIEFKQLDQVSNACMLAAVAANNTGLSFDNISFASNGMTKTGVVLAGGSPLVHQFPNKSTALVIISYSNTECAKIDNLDLSTKCQQDSRYCFNKWIVRPR
ncbi:MAG: hypothetical protein WCO00_07970 [Rhodospirillaceae bacterium]